MLSKSLQRHKWYLWK